jgi:hypothetical protein
MGIRGAVIILIGSAPRTRQNAEEGEFGRVKRILVMALLTSLAAPVVRAADPTGTVSLSAEEIFARLEQENQIRTENLHSYSAVRRYSVFEKNKPSDAEMTVAMQFESPSTKRFRVISQKGLGWVHGIVFRRLMRTEQETAGGEAKMRSAITSSNYDVELSGETECFNRSCYVLKLHPKRRDKFLVEGDMWVDKEDFAVVRLEGEPSRSFSFWVTRAHLVRDYQKLGDFWLPLRDETQAHVRIAGDYFFRIEHTNYHLNQ